MSKSANATVPGGNRIKKTELRAVKPERFDQSKATTEILKRYSSYERFQKLLVSEAIEIGRLLRRMKRELGHGEWLPYLRSDLEWPSMRAERFMNVAEYLEAHPTLNWQEYQLTELYHASADWRRGERGGKNHDVEA